MLMIADQFFTLMLWKKPVVILYDNINDNILIVVVKNQGKT